MKADNVFVVRRLDEFESVTQCLEKQGFHYHYPILTQQVIEANKMISEMMQVPIASKVFSYKKIRIVENVPRSLEQIYIDYKRVPGIEQLELEDQSLYQVLKDKYGFVVHKSEEEIRIVHANSTEAELLHLKENSEVLLTTGISYVDRFGPLEYYELTSIPGFFKYRSVDQQ